MKLRLDKYLSEMGYGTRSEVKRAIAKGQVRINASVVRKPEMKLDTETDCVFFQEEQVGYAAFEYYMLNKPAGVISATEDDKEQTVIDLIRTRKRQDLFPVGRLDKDTEGLLLITNDGALAHRLLSPKKHVDKTYYARIDRQVTEADIHAFAEGVSIGDEKPTMPAKLRILQEGPPAEIELTIREGRFHQVKRMFRARGKEVLYLKRFRMGSLILDETLKPGEYRKLTKREIEELC